MTWGLLEDCYGMTRGMIARRLGWGWAPLRPVLIVWLATVVVGLLPSDRSGYPNTWNKAFEVSGQSRSWRVTSLFTPADFGPAQEEDLGFEFSTGNLLYTGQPTQIRWYRMEVLLPDELSLRVRPGPPGNPAACAVDTRDTAPRGGTMTLPGTWFTHGRCEVYPWRRSATELANQVSKGLYVVTWEDAKRVHAEVLPLSQVTWQ